MTSERFLHIQYFLCVCAGVGGGWGGGGMGGGGWGGKEYTAVYVGLAVPNFIRELGRVSNFN